MQNYPPPAGGQSFPPPGNPYGAPQTPASPKKSKTPWIIAGVGCLLLAGIGLIVLIGVLAYIGKKAESTVSKNLPRDVPVAQQEAGTKQYVNTRVGRTGDLAENYVDFSFYYPEDWQIVPNQTKNFVKVERKDEDETTLENFAVGWISLPGTSLDKQLLPQLAEQVGTQFAQSFTDFEKVSEGETRIGPYEGYEIKFTAKLKRGAHDQVDIYGRVALVPPPDGGKQGVALVMLATDRAPEIGGVDDVGVKGEMPVILDSFRFGSK